VPILLDTTVLIDVLRGTSSARARLLEVEQRGEVPLACAVNVEELVRGLRPEEEDVADRLLRGVRIAPLGRFEGAQAGRWRREHARRGVTLSQSDCLAGARLATGNPRHFPFEELIVEHWPAGA
jgi:predicted nucleic acid-binding protein